MWDQNQGDQFFKTAKLFVDPMSKVWMTYSRSIISTDRQAMDMSIVFAKGQTARLRIAKENEDKYKKEKEEIDYQPYSYAEINLIEYLRLTPSVGGRGRTELRDTMVGFVQPEIERSSRGRKGRK